jgi:hypothetical protein
MQRQGAVKGYYRSHELCTGGLIAEQYVAGFEQWTATDEFEPPGAPTPYLD